MQINIATGPWLPVPALQGGAIPRLWQGLAEQFAAQGHQVKILCRSYPSQPSHEIINGVTYIRRGGLPQSTNIQLDLLKDLAYAITTFPLLPTADILVINDFWLPVFATLRPQVGKVVINVNRFPKGQYWLYPKNCQFAVASNSIRDAIAQEYPPAIPRMQVFPNPIDTTIFSPPVLPRILREEKTILYVGRVHPEKGIHLLIDAFLILVQQLPQVHLKIVGPIKESQGGGGQNYLQTLKNKANGLPIDFVDPIFNPNELANVYRSADLFCYPSLAEKGESFGVAPLEAMATGLVPVVSSLDCFQDFIQSNETGYFFDHRDTNADQNIAQTLASAILNWDKTVEIGTNAAKEAQNYSYQKISEFYLNYFETSI